MGGRHLTPSTLRLLLLSDISLVGIFGIRLVTWNESVLVPIKIDCFLFFFVFFMMKVRPCLPKTDYKMHLTYQTTLRGADVATLSDIKKLPCNIKTQQGPACRIHEAAARAALRTFATCQLRDD